MGKRCRSWGLSSSCHAFVVLNKPTRTLIYVWATELLLLLYWRRGHRAASLPTLLDLLVSWEFFLIPRLRFKGWWRKKKKMSYFIENAIFNSCIVIWEKIGGTKLMDSCKLKRSHNIITNIRTWWLEDKFNPLIVC